MSKTLLVDMPNKPQADIPPIGTPYPRTQADRKRTVREVWQWPEWKAFATRLGIKNDHIRRCVVTLDIAAAPSVEVVYLVTEPCPPHPSDTSHTVTPEAAQSAAPTHTSVGTTNTGHACEDCS